MRISRVQQQSTAYQRLRMLKSSPQPDPALGRRVSGSALDLPRGTFRRKGCAIGSNLAEPYGLPLASLSPTLRALDDGTFLRGGRASFRKPVCCRQRACACDDRATGSWYGLGRRPLPQLRRIIRVEVLVFADYSPSEMQ